MILEGQGLAFAIAEQADDLNAHALTVCGKYSIREETRIYGLRKDAVWRQSATGVPSESRTANATNMGRP